MGTEIFLAVFRPIERKLWQGALHRRGMLIFCSINEISVNIVTFFVLLSKSMVTSKQIHETQVLQNYWENPRPHTLQPQPSRTMPWLPVRYQPATCSLPCILCSSTLLVYNPSRPCLTPECKYHLNQTRSFFYSYIPGIP